MQLWILLSMVYPIGYGVANLIDKFLLDKKIRNYYAYGSVVGFFLFISSLFVLGLTGVPMLPMTVWFFVMISGLCFGLVYLIYYRLVQSQEMSRIIGINYIFPGFVAIGSFLFLDEKLALIKYGGIVLAILGALLLGVEKKRKQWKFSRLFWINLLIPLLLGVGDLSDKYIVQFMSPWQAYGLAEIVLGVVLFVPLLKGSVRRALPKIRTLLVPLMLTSTASFLGTAIFFVAAAQGPITIVSAFGTLQPIFVFLAMCLLSVFMPKLLKEVITPSVLKYKLAGIVCVVIGAIILSY